MSARLRLTLSYAGFLVVAGAAQAALLVYVLRFVPAGNLVLDGGGFVPDRDDLLQALLPRIGQVLAALAIVGLVGGWFLAGRMLWPLARINAVARSVAAGSLDDRVRLGGRDDEFRQLSDTFDQMLDRLQQSFDEQRRFAANAAHELRTPYAVTKSMLDVARADPAGQDVERLVRRLADTNRRGIEIVEALLALATLDHGLVPDRSPVDLTETVAEVVDDLRPLAADAGVAFTGVLGEGDIDGSPTLVRQLVSNLVANGIRHNVRDGWVEVSTASLPDSSVELSVRNSGAVVDQRLLARLTEPFVRGAGRVAASRPGAATSAHEGSGLGLALVARVAAVHGAALTIDAPAEGGLHVRVRFPAPSGVSGP